MRRGLHPQADDALCQACIAVLADRPARLGDEAAALGAGKKVVDFVDLVSVNIADIFGTRLWVVHHGFDPHRDVGSPIHG